MEASDLREAQPTLLGLPLELREKILDHLVDCSAPPIKASDITSIRQIKHGVNQQTLNLLLTCSKLHHDVETMLIKRRTYKFDFVSDIRRFIEAFPHLGSIKHIQFGINLCRIDIASLKWVCAMIQPYLKGVESLMLAEPSKGFLRQTFRPSYVYINDKKETYVARAYNFNPRFLLVRSTFPKLREARIFAQHTDHSMSDNKTAETLMLITDNSAVIPDECLSDESFWLLWCLDVNSEGINTAHGNGMRKVWHELTQAGSLIEHPAYK